jgi:alpha-galactosidase/6-phospho-beta-glucosidase family protein
MKIAFIGGSSVQWTARLVVDMLLTKALAGADLVLHDIDPVRLICFRGPASACYPVCC